MARLTLGSTGRALDGGRAAAAAAVGTLVLLALLTPSARAQLDFDLNEAPPPSEQDELSEPDEPEAMEAAAAEQGRAGGATQLAADDEAASWLQRRLRAAASLDVRLPQYFSFDAFASSFRRKYSAAEAALRRSVFLAKCVRVFRDRVAYRTSARSYLTAINKFSDQTAAEFNSRYMALPPVESAAAAGRRGADYRAELARRHAALEREASVQRAQLEARALEGVSRCSAHEPEAAPGAACKLAELAEQDAQLAGELAELLAGADGGAALDELREAHMEQESQLAPEAPGGDELPEPGQLRSQEAVSSRTVHWTPRAHLDWSRHDCFHEVYDQGLNCGKCYVMATTALAEFYKCSERAQGQPVKRRKFSKDYVLECAPKFTPNVLGCAGGSPLDTLRFIAHAGVFNIRDWRAKRQELAQTLGARDKCPLSHPELPFDQWGPTRVLMNPQPVELTAEALVDALQDGPLVVSVQMPPEGVDSYAGGVHDGAGCASSGLWHAMLLVGYGRTERGQPYWRFRNSWGADWGERGHFHLAFEAPWACFASAVRVFREPPSPAAELAE